MSGEKRKYCVAQRVAMRQALFCAVVRTLEDERIRARLQSRFACAGLVPHANDNHFHLRETGAKPMYHFDGIAAPQRKIDDDQRDRQP